MGGSRWCGAVALAVFAIGCSSENPNYGVFVQASSGGGAAAAGDDDTPVDAGETGETGAEDDGNGGSRTGGDDGDTGGGSPDVGGDEAGSSDRGEACVPADLELDVTVTIQGMEVVGDCGEPIRVVGPASIDGATGELVIKDCGGACDCGGVGTDHRFAIEPLDLMQTEPGGCADVLVDYDRVEGASCELSSIVVRSPDPLEFPWFIAGRSLLEPSSFSGLAYFWTEEATSDCAGDVCPDRAPGTYGLEVNAVPPQLLAEGEPFQTLFQGLNPPVLIELENHLSRVDEDCKEHITWTVHPVEP
ncbi:MAG: hypothetical protein AAF721_03515 [Myxococcota bacterium]